MGADPREHLGAAEFQTVSDRVQGLTLAAGETAVVQVAGVRVEALHISHGPGMTIQNLGFLVRLGSVSIVHVGDAAIAPDDLAPCGLAARSIDVALVPYWLMLGDGWPALREAFGARRYVAMHLPALDAPAMYFRPASSLAELLALVRTGQPDVEIFADVMQSLSL